MGVPVRARSTRSPRARRTSSTWIEPGEVDLVINTPTGSGARTDGYEIRRAAIARGIPCITTMSGGAAAARAIARAPRAGEAPRCCSLQELHPREPRRRSVSAGAVRPPRAARSSGARRSAPTTCSTSHDPTGPRPRRASSTCWPRSSAGAGARASGRSCRARSRVLRARDGAAVVPARGRRPGHATGCGARRRATGSGSPGRSGSGFGARARPAPGAGRRRRRHRAARVLARRARRDAAGAAGLSRRAPREGRARSRADAPQWRPTTARPATTGS